MKIRNLKIGTQLIIGLTIILFLVLVIGFVSYLHSGEINKQTETIYEHPLQVRRAIGTLRLNISEMQNGLQKLYLSESEKDIDESVNEMEISYADAVEQIEIIHQKYLGPKTDIENAHNAFVKWNLKRLKCEEMLLHNKVKESYSSILKKYEFESLNKEMMTYINVLDTYAENKANELLNNSKNLNVKLNYQLYVLVCFIMVLAVLISYYLILLINKPVNSILIAAKKFQEGDLNVRSEVGTTNELGKLSNAINSMVESIQNNLIISQRVAKLSDLMMAEEVSRNFFKALLPVLSAETNSQMAAVYLLSEDKKVFEHYESVGLADEARLSFNVDSFQGEFGPVLATREIQFVKRVPIDTRFVFQTVSGKYIPREIITIPIISGNDVIAMISLASVRTYSDQNIMLINRLFDTLTARVDGVLAYRKMRKFAEQLELQNRELELQKSELSAQSIELNEQNRELEMQKNQLSEASRLKTNFLSNMSHELRTPLNSVIALTGVLNRRLATKIPATEYSYLEVIERNGKHLLSLINDILDISRIEAGKEEVEVVEFSVNQLVADVVGLIEPQAKAKKIRLLQKKNNSNLLIKSDIHKCQHVLQNLIGNAVKFTEKGLVEVEVCSVENNIKIIITDTGIGISEENLRHIFDEFRQADGSTSRRFGGSGLGLAIAKKYANLLGGNITVKSQLDSGSEFTLVLPLEYHSDNRIVEDESLSNIIRPKVSDFPVKQILNNTSKSSKTILLVEDSEPAIIQMKDFLEESGYKILVGRNGQEALDILDKVIPDAMVLDLMMPGVDGFSVLKNIRELDKTAHVPVLILTAKHITREDLKFLKRNNVHQLIQKGDVNRVDLLAAIENMVTIKIPDKVRTKVEHTKKELRVLIVEDNKDNMLTVKAIIGDRYKILEAEDGNEAVKMAKLHKPDFILMDIALPFLDGIEAFKQIRNNGELSHIPIFALTASAMTSDRETILAYGFDGYLVKPIDEKMFFKTLNEILYGK